MVRGLISERSYPWAVEPAGLNGSVVVVDAGGRMQRKAAGGETQGGPAHRLGNIAQKAPPIPILSIRVPRSNTSWAS